MIDSQTLKSLRDLPIEGVAQRLGMRITRHRALCPFHDDHHPSLSFHERTNTYTCFSCGAHGGVIDLVMKYNRQDFKEAVRWLNPETLPSPRTLPSPPCLGRENQQDKGNFKSPPKQRGMGGAVFDASKYSRFFEHPHLSDAAKRFLYDERHIDPRVVSYCRLNSYRDKHGTEWLQIPYYDSEGKLIGLQSRNLDPPLPKDPPLPSLLREGEGSYLRGEKRGGESLSGNLSSPPKQGDLGGLGMGGLRFRFPRGAKCSIYNLQILKLLKPDDDLWITEGASDCWAMLSSGCKAIAIPSATLLSQQDKELLKNLSSPPKQGGMGGLGMGGLRFHMYPDQDAPGERLFLQLKEILPEIRRYQLPKGVKDYGELWAINNKQ